MPLIRTGRNVRFTPQQSADTSEQFKAFINLQETVQGIAGNVSNTLFEARAADSEKTAREQAEVDAATQATQNRIVVDGDDNPIDVVEPQLRSGSLDRFLGPSVSTLGYNRQAEALYLEQKRIVQETELTRLAEVHQDDSDAFLDAAESYRESVKDGSLPQLSGTLDLGLQGSILSAHTKIRAKEVATNRGKAQAVALTSIETSGKALKEAFSTLQPSDPAVMAKFMEYQQNVKLALDQNFIKDAGPYMQVARQLMIAGGLKREMTKTGYSPELVQKILKGNLEFETLWQDPETGKMEVRPLKLSEITSVDERETMAANIQKTGQFKEKLGKDIRKSAVKSIQAKLLMLGMDALYAYENKNEWPIDQEELNRLMESAAKITEAHEEEMAPVITMYKQLIKDNTKRRVYGEIAEQFMANMQNPAFRAQAELAGVDDIFDEAMQAFEMNVSSRSENDMLMAALSRMVKVDSDSADAASKYALKMATISRERRQSFDNFVELNLDPELEGTARTDAIQALQDQYIQNSVGNILPDGHTLKPHKDWENRRLQHAMNSYEFNQGLVEPAIEHIGRMEPFGTVPTILSNFMTKEAPYSRDIGKIDAALQLYAAMDAKPGISEFLSADWNLGQNATNAYRFIAPRFSGQDTDPEDIARFRNILEGREKFDMPPGFETRSSVARALFGKQGNKSGPLREHVVGSEPIDFGLFEIGRKHSYFPQKMREQIVNEAMAIIPGKYSTGDTDWLENSAKDAVAKVKRVWGVTKLGSDKQLFQRKDRDVVVYAERPPEQAIASALGLKKPLDPKGQLIKFAMMNALKEGGIPEEEAGEMIAGLGKTLFLSREPIRTVMSGRGVRIPVYGISRVPTMLDQKGKRVSSDRFEMLFNQTGLPLTLEMRHFILDEETQKKAEKAEDEELIERQEKAKAEDESIGEFIERQLRETREFWRESLDFELPDEQSSLPGPAVGGTSAS